MKLFLLDSLDKRISFIREEAEKLHLTNLQAEHGRAEDFAAKQEYREHFDLCVSRAVANLSTLSEYCLPFIHIHGWFIPYKTETADEETKKAAYAFGQLGGSVRNTIHFSLPGNGGNRSLVMIEKIKVTPKKYPRKAGTPSRKPL